MYEARFDEKGAGIDTILSERRPCRIFEPLEGRRTRQVSCPTAGERVPRASQDFAGGSVLVK